MFDAIVDFAAVHYFIFGAVALGVGVVLNLVFRCGPEIVDALRHPRLH